MAVALRSAIRAITAAAWSYRHALPSSLASLTYRRGNSPCQSATPLPVSLSRILLLRRHGMSACSAGPRIRGPCPKWRSGNSSVADDCRFISFPRGLAKVR